MRGIGTRSGGTSAIALAFVLSWGVNTGNAQPGGREAEEPHATEEPQEPAESESGTAPAAFALDRYRRITLTSNLLYLFIPVFELSADVALNRKWTVGLRGGAGESTALGTSHRISEIGAQGAYYVHGTVDRGIYVGAEGRAVRYEGDGQLLSLGDGVALGPIVGYKWTAPWGLTLMVHGGPEFVVQEEENDSLEQEQALFYLYAGAGWSLWSSGPSQESAATADAAPLEPFETHRGFLVGGWFGGGLPVVSDCADCKLRPGISGGGHFGYFLSPRWALVLDAHAILSLHSSGLNAVGVGVAGLGVQTWALEDLWLRVGVGPTRLLTAFGGDEIGGGGTLAAGYVFHRSRAFNMDVQLRASHASFDSEQLGIDWFVGGIGLNWP